MTDSDRQLSYNPCSFFRLLPFATTNESAYQLSYESANQTSNARSYQSPDGDADGHTYESTNSIPHRAPDEASHKGTH